MLCPAALLAGGHSYPAQPCSPRLFCSPRSLCLLLPQRNEEAAKEGRPLELFWRRQYVPQVSPVQGGGRGGGCMHPAGRQAVGAGYARGRACVVTPCCSASRLRLAPCTRRALLNQPKPLPCTPTHPQEGMFRDPPADLQLGTRLPEVGLCGRRLSLGPPEAFMLCCARGPLPKLAALL